MYKERKICVVVPCFNEAKLISKTLVGIPNFVDKIIVVDDFSKDDSTEIVVKLKKKDNRIFLIQHNQNRGVGAAIKSGYQLSIDENFDISVVMAGDNQMDPNELPNLLDPLITNQADYSKGNRLNHKDKNKMPLFRYFGNSLLTLLNKISTGFWEISDPQNGYTAIKREALSKMDFDSIYDGYGYCNDILLEANVNKIRVKDVNMPPRYGSEISGIRIGRYSIRLSYILVRGFFRRINKKYGGSNFHPILISYYSSFLFLFLFSILSLRMFWLWYFIGEIPKVNAMAVGVLFIITLQFLLFSFWSDSQNNK